MLVDYLLGGFPAAATAGAEAAALGEMTDVHGAFLYRFPDIVVGDRSAETHVHGLACPLFVDDGTI